jgi:uncharacterized protein (TIGR03083 family)
MTADVDLGALYAAARQRITAVLEDVAPEVATRLCAATPGWTVHDVVAHVRGITGDVRTGNLAGVTTDPWTAAQVERHRNDPLPQLLEDWAVDAAPFEAFLSGPHGEGAGRAVIDLHAHEHDIYGAVVPGAGCEIRPALPEPFVAWGLAALVHGFAGRVREAGLDAVCVRTEEGDVFGPVDAPVTLAATRFELFRAMLGRRSAAQVCAFDWVGADPTIYIPTFFVFNPRRDPLVE